MKLFLYTLLLWMLGGQAVFGQEYGYTNYGSKDGLPSATVYCMTQDKDGFIWFGTETGLSRFDGTHFRNFTLDDGLPDNEIIQLFADSKGRVWISPFKKTICYYYKGKIHTQENDSLLKRLQITGNVMQFAEDDQGNILLMETSRLHLVTAGNKVHSVNRINGAPVKYLSAVGRNPAGSFWVIEENRLYEYSNRLFSFVKTIDLANPHFTYTVMSDKLFAIRNNNRQTTIESVLTHKKLQFPSPLFMTNFSIIDDAHVAMNTPTGTTVYNINNADSTLNFLPGVRVCGVKKDTEGNLWFTTLGQGVYRLNSAFVLNSKFRDYNTSHQILSFAQDGKFLLVGSDMNVIYRLHVATGVPDKIKIVLKNGRVEPIAGLHVNSEKNIVFGTNIGVFKISTQFRPVSEWGYLCVKSFYSAGARNKDDLYVVSDRNIVRIDPITTAIKDTIWHERATAVFAAGDTFYIGTINGLYRRLPNGSIQFMGERFAPFRNRIAAITRDSNLVLWVATFGGGMVAFKNEQIAALIKQEQGLTSNICRTLFLNSNYLWVGTDKGLNKIRLDDTTYPVKKYTTGDGLVSDIINVLYVDKSKVFIGTPEGVTFFDEEKITSQSRCELRFTDVIIAGKNYYPGQAPAVLPHEKNSIQFNFVGISYKSNGDIRYRYRLLGLDSNWKETRETFLSYPTLPSGDYQLQVQAVNKFDVSSKLLTTAFTIDKLLYERTWFRLLTGLLFLAITGIVVFLIIRRIRKREQEKTAISKRISELEQLSRKAQMNPHFIFNSLNSIQHYVMDSDVTGANKFISGFSRLIRQTLDFSSKPEISLEEELDYLTNYLELERTRLEGAFAWRVVKEEGIDAAEYYIPPMILQPFVENSVRHGLRFRRDKNGLVTIMVKRTGDHLVCIVEDNGVGRKAAMQYKSISPINYQSKGLSLTADRITMFNKEHEQKITMQIDDLEDDDHASLGTRVTISFPIL
jgi:ligand-binding sensor domain-containing protein